MPLAQESLERLCVDYIDIIQCHDIEFGSLQQVVEETLPGALHSPGCCVALGVLSLSRPPLQLSTR